MKILLCDPPAKYMTHGLEATFFTGGEAGNYPSAGLLSLATYIMKNSSHTVKVLDCIYDGMSLDDALKIMREFKPDIVGVTTYTHTLYGVENFLNLVKNFNKDIITVAGGPHLQSFAKETAEWKNVDYAIAGDGEKVLFDLITAIDQKTNINDVKGVTFVDESGNLVSGGYNVIKDLDSIPSVDFGLFDVTKGYCTIGVENICASIITSRGCPFSCTFCLSAHGDYRERDMENIIEEIKTYINVGVTEFFIWDELFNLTTKRVIEFSEMILKHNLKIRWSFRGVVGAIDDEMLTIAKKSGLDRIQYGVEAGTDESLKKIKKGTKLHHIRAAMSKCRQHKIKTVTNWIFGFPFETKEDLGKTLAFAIELDSDFAEFNVLLPFPGTEEYIEGVKNKQLDPQHVEQHIRQPQKDFKFQVFETNFTKKELYEFSSHAYKSFYLRPSYILRSLFQTQSFFSFRKKVYGALLITKEYLSNIKIFSNLINFNSSPKVKPFELNN